MEWGGGNVLLIVDEREREREICGIGLRVEENRDSSYR